MQLPLQKSVVIFLVLFLLIFPKAGVKIDALPLTVGYFALALTALALFCHLRYQIVRDRLIALALLFPFQLVALITIFMYGSVSSSYLVSFFISAFILPWFFLGVFSERLEEMDLSFLFCWLKRGVFYVALYGVVVFLYRMWTGKLIVLPFLTANFHDADLLEVTKCIARGDWLKLFSTYQNGILYGVSLLIFFPFYCLLEKSLFKKGIVTLSLILTLTRTVWIGLLAYQVGTVLFYKKKTPQLLLIQILLGVGLICWVVVSLGFDFRFLFDPTLGGRSSQLAVLSHLQLMGSQPFDALKEILYLSILLHFGMMGLLCFLVGWISPLILYWMKSERKDPVKESLSFGLLLYLLIACGDGAFLYIPVMAFYWFTASLLLSDRVLDLLPQAKSSTI